MKISKTKLILALALLSLLAFLFPAATFIGLIAIIAIGNILNSRNAACLGLISGLGSATLNYQLTAYAQGLWNDISDVIKLAERLAPTTPVPGAAGQFKKFDDKNSFMPEKTARALGGDPVIINFNASDDAYSCKPQALEVRVDKAEDQAAGDAGGEVEQNLLDQGKIKALINKVALSHVLDVTTTVLNAVPAGWTGAPAGLGNWSNPDVDPIAQLDAALLQISQNCGSTQNIMITMDVTAWNALRTNPKVRQNAVFAAAAAVGNISVEMLRLALIIPVDIMIANVVYDTTRLNQAPNKTRVLQGVCLVHYSLPNATIYDPSAFKSFTVGSAGFIGQVRTYIAANQLYRGHLIDWSRDIHQTSSLSMLRINQN